MNALIWKVAVLTPLVVVSSFAVATAQPIDIGSRRELFVDRLLIDRMEGVALRLHRPVKTSRPKSPLPEKHYFTVLKDKDHDGQLFRAYWRETNPDYPGPFHTGHAGEMVCYGESRDGHEWTFPELGLHEIRSSRGKNVMLANQPPLLTNFTPFIDTRPGVKLAERYKALGGYPGPGDKRGKSELGWGLFAFVSADGIHWAKKTEVIPYQPAWRHAFDSQNCSFWSQAASPDFKTWTKPVAMNPNLPGEHLYTSQTHPYFRSPHIYIATPTRFVPDRGDAPGYDKKDVNATDILFMSTRAGTEKYDRVFTEAFMRPGLDAQRWRNRSNYVALNVIPTAPSEVSIYHRSGDRYVLRSDGFVSVNAGSQTGELVTRPLIFSGKELHLNLSTSAVGLVQVEMQDEAGQPIPGFTLDDCPIVYGDGIDLTVKWKNGRNLSSLVGKPVRVRFVLKECDLFSFRFQ